MGAPKQKWTSQEESALKAGVLKHGTGKWRTILSDPEFTSVLKSRSNVDLKDKWRNISVTAIYGSRKKAKLALKKNPTSHDDDNATALTIVAIANGQQISPPPPPPPPVVSCLPPPRDFEGLYTSVDKMILEAITNFKKQLGPDGKSILLYVEEKHNMQPDMKRLVTSRLKHLVNVGTLVKIKHRYRISRNNAAAGGNQGSPRLLLEGNKENDDQNPSRSQVDGEVFMINGMTAQEAAAAAAKAVVEAEFARAEAEEAAIEADKAEAEAEAAYIFAKASRKALKYSNVVRQDNGQV